MCVCVCVFFINPHGRVLQPQGTLYQAPGHSMIMGVGDVGLPRLQLHRNVQNEMSVIAAGEFRQGISRGRKGEREGGREGEEERDKLGDSREWESPLYIQHILSHPHTITTHPHTITTHPPPGLPHKQLLHCHLSPLRPETKEWVSVCRAQMAVHF